MVATPDSSSRLPEAAEKEPLPQGRWGSIWRWLEPLLLAVAPGALAGTQLAGLLFFLNPHWPFEAWTLFRAMAFYCSLLGAASAVLLLPFTWVRPHRARRLLPWTLVVVFALSGILHGAHASHFSYYLPAGINRRLIKAALWLSLAAVASFYTALLHSLRRQPYRIRSTAGLLLLSLLSVYAVLERRDAFDPTPQVSPRRSTVEAQRRPNLLFVGLASATLDVVLPLAEQGQLPFFAALLEEGAYGRLQTIEPTRAEPLWTSLASGKLPFRHGILGPQRYPAGFIRPELEFRLTPVGLLFRQWGIPGGQLPGPRQPERRALTLWEIAKMLGFETFLVGWPGALPSEDLASAPPMPDPSLSHTADVSTTVARQNTEASKADRHDDPRFETLPNELKRVATDGAAADIRRYSVARRELDRQRLAATDSADGAKIERPSDDRPSIALFLQLPGLEPVARRSFGGYSAVQFEGRQGEAFEQAATLLASYYSLVDGLLKELWSRRAGLRPSVARAMARAASGNHWSQQTGAPMLA